MAHASSGSSLHRPKGGGGSFLEEALAPRCLGELNLWRRVAVEDAKQDATLALLNLNDVA